MLQENATQIPLWVVASLGKEIILDKEFAGSCETYMRGCRGVLSGILVDENYGGSPYAIVALDPNDTSYLENFLFDDIRPVSENIKFGLNIEQGIIAF